MTLAAPARRFGAGGDEPWAGALRAGSADLELVRHDDAGGTEPMELQRWLDAADDVDVDVLRGLDGPLLDIGCGPGRMVRAGLDAGLDAWGLDADPAAVALCREHGLPVYAGSVFGTVARAGEWSSLLLLDGNIGIGGDVTALLARCAALLTHRGRLVVEVHADPQRDETGLWRLRGADGAESEPFPWSQVGAHAVVRAARGFRLERSWRTPGRAFLLLRRR